MILIAICDDNKNVREDLRKLLIQYSFERKEDFKIFLFASSQEFCETLVEVEYDIIVASEAYDEYVKDGCKSKPISKLWDELDL